MRPGGIQDLPAVGIVGNEGDSRIPEAHGGSIPSRHSRAEGASGVSL